MRQTVYLATLVAVLSPSTSFAADGAIPQATLASLGLSDLEVLSDSYGSEVRGRSGNAFALGLSMVTGFLVDSDTNSFVFGSDSNTAEANAENSGLHVFNTAQENHESATVLNLDVTGGTGGWTGSSYRGSGGSAIGSPDRECLTHCTFSQRRVAVGRRVKKLRPTSNRE